MTGSAPSPDDASYRRENHEAPLVPFILRDAHIGALLPSERNCARPGGGTGWTGAGCFHSRRSCIGGAMLAATGRASGRASFIAIASQHHAPPLFGGPITCIVDLDRLKGQSEVRQRLPAGGC